MSLGKEWEKKVIHPTDTYLAMEKLVGKGLARDIGVSNFNETQIKDILKKAKIKPATNQVECHPHFNQASMLAFLKRHDIVLTAYSPLGSPGSSWRLKDKPNVLEDPTLKALAEKYSKMPAQVALRWQLQRGVAVVPKSGNPGRIAANLNVEDFQLSKDDMAKLDALDKGRKGRYVLRRDRNGRTLNRDHPHFPFSQG